MNDQINQYQQRLFYKLFTTLPSVRKADGFSNDLDFDCVIDSFYYFKNKDFWFTRGKQKDKFIYLFGLKNKPVKDISGKDACLVLDFDKNIQFNDNCLGLFSIKSSEIHILINYNILKDRYSYISTSNFKLTNFKSVDGSIDLEVIDLGNLDSFIENIEKLINAASMIKSQKDNTSEKIKEYSDVCEICSKKKSNFKLDSNLSNLKKSKPELCGKCIEKIVASEFYTKLVPFLKGNNSDELIVAKEKFGNDQQFEIGLKLLEKYKIIQYIGVKKLFYTLDKNSYLVKKFIKYSDKNNLLIDNIKLDKIDKSPEQTVNDNFQENNIEKQMKIVKTDSFGNKNTIDQMNRILEELSKGKSEDESIGNANVSKNTYDYWINRGKQEFGKIYVQFYQYVNEIKSELDGTLTIDKRDGKSEDKDGIFVDNGIYEPLLAEYEELFNSMNQTGIAWVNQNGSMWVYSRNINGVGVDLTANTITELYKKVINNNLIWGIRDYGLAKKFIDIPDDFEIPNMETEGSFDNIDDNFYAPLSEEYEKSFSSMNKTGIAWVNQVGSKFYYMKSVKGKNIKISSENIQDLYEKVKKANQIWGIRDYGLAKKFIDISDDFEVPSKPQVRKQDVYVELDSGIYSPLPEEYERSFTSMNNSGIAWVNQIGSKLYYVKSVNGKNIRLSSENIYELYEKVKKANQIWGIRDYSRASQYIKIPKDFKIPKKQKKEIIPDTEIDESIYDPLPLDELSKFNPNPNNKTGIAWVNKIGNKWNYQRQKNGKSVRISDSDIVKLHKKVIDNDQIWGIIDIEKARKVIKTNSIDDEKPSKPVNQVKNSKVTVNYIEKSINKFEILIKGIIKNKDLVDILVRLDLFKGNINRIITTSLNKEEYDMFIELEINKQLLHLFEDKIEDLGWKINK